MALRILNRSFSGGEITPELFGRLELSKVQEALALCLNFITLPHGPVVNRPGTEFVEEVKNSANPTRLIPFSYNNTQTFAIQLGAGYFRFHTQGGTLQCGTLPGWSSTTAYDLGAAVSYGGVNYYCLLPNTNLAPPNATYWYAMPAGGDYEIPNPYAAADLMDIHYTQSADVLTLTHPNYPIMELRRFGATTWELTPVSFSPLVATPVGTASAGTPISHQYAVTALIRGSRRSGRGHQAFYYETTASPSASCSCDLTQYGAYNTITWPPVLSAASYKVYKYLGGVYQCLGSASGTSFTDTYTITAGANALANPPAVAYGNVSGPASCSATAYPSTIGTLNAIPTGTGTVTYSYVVTALDSSGNESYASSAASCQNNLSTAGNYNTINWPSVENAQRYNVYKSSYGIYGFIGQVGQGALSLVDNNITADISRTPPYPHDNQLAGPNDYPAAVAYYQQRRIFAGTLNQPQNVWATRSGTESDLSYTIPTRDDNRIAFRIAGREASAIRHIVPLQDLLFLSASCEWRCSSTGGVLTPTTINVQPQSYVGANNVQPVVVGNAVLYAAARGGHMRQLSYNWQINGYQTTDSSIFAPHLFDYSTIVDMAYSRGPIPILWCVSSTGKLLGMTYLPEQQIAAWHQHATGNGDTFESICTITEAPSGSTAGEDMLYCIVRRTVNGVTKRFVERMHTRLYNSLADCHYVDCGATYNGANNKNGTYFRSGVTTLTCSITAHGLTNGQTYWFSFSDASLGTLPTGAPYTVNVVDANTFTLSVANSPALTASNVGVSGAINGANTAFDLLGASSETVVALSGSPSVYKTDWQGKQLQYSTARTNLLQQSNGFTSAPWITDGCTITSTGVMAPDGVSVTFQCIYTGPASLQWGWLTQSQSVGAGGNVGKTYTGSVWAWVGAGTKNIQLRISDVFFNTMVSNPITLTTTPTRISFTTSGPVGGWNAGGSRIGFGIDPPSDGTPIYVCFGDLKASAALTSYIPTAATPVTVTDYALTSPAHIVFSSAPASGATLSWSGSYFNASGAVTQLASSITGLSWLNGMAVNILADGAVLPQQTVNNGTITLPTGATQVHVGLPITAQLQTPPASAAIDPSMAQGLVKNVNKVFLRTYRSSGILAGPDFADLTPYRQRTTENPGSPPNLASDEIEILLTPDWGSSGQVCIQQSDPLPLDIAAMTLEIAVGGGV